MNERIPVDLIDRYLSGVADDADRERVLRWLSRAEHAKIAEQLCEIRPGAYQGGGELDLEAAVQRLMSAGPERVQVLADGTMAPTQKGVPSRGWGAMRRNDVGRGMGGRGLFGVGTLRGWGWSVSAVSAVVLGVIMLLPLDNVPRHTGHTYVTNASQQGVVTLHDGTRVTLAPNTTLRVEQFDRHARMVDVKGGEAYFDISRSSDAPFVVRSGPLSARVLGTAFLIRNDREGTRVRISVADGRVRVSEQWHPDAGVVLGVGQIGEVVDSTTHVSTVDDLVPSAEWRRDRVVFHDTQVSIVLAALSRWYGYQFRCVDPMLSQKSVTIMVSMQSSASALATLEQILRVNLTVVGDTVTLAPQHKQRAKGSLQRIRNYDVWTPTREVGR